MASWPGWANGLLAAGLGLVTTVGFVALASCIGGREIQAEPQMKRNGRFIEWLSRRSRLFLPAMVAVVLVAVPTAYTIFPEWGSDARTSWRFTILGLWIAFALGILWFAMRLYVARRESSYQPDLPFEDTPNI